MALYTLWLLEGGIGKTFVGPARNTFMVMRMVVIVVYGDRVVSYVTLTLSVSRDKNAAPPSWSRELRSPTRVNLLATKIFGLRVDTTTDSFLDA